MVISLPSKSFKIEIEFVNECQHVVPSLAIFCEKWSSSFLSLQHYITGCCFAHIIRLLHLSRNSCTYTPVSLMVVTSCFHDLTKIWIFCYLFVVWTLRSSNQVVTICNSFGGHFELLILSFTSKWFYDSFSKMAISQLLVDEFECNKAYFLADKITF